jgi:Tfp pilus assembly protein PilF
MRSGVRIAIGLTALFLFGGVPSARAQFGGEFRSEAGFGGEVIVGNSLDGPAWYMIHAAVDAKLEQTDLIQLARSAATAKPTLDPTQLLERLDIFVRAGDRKQADQTIGAMAHTSLTQSTYPPGAAADFLIAHGEWDLARHLMNLCPNAAPSNRDFFIVHFEHDPTFPNLDGWLAHREHLNPSYWTQSYLLYRRAMGTLRPLLDARAADIRAHPQDLERIDTYLTVASHFEPRPDLSWLPAVCRLPLAIENLAAGAKLSAWPAVSVLFLERALQMPVTFDDYVWLETQNGAAPADFRNEPTQDAIRHQAKLFLLERYRAIQQPDKAQKMQEEITAELPKVANWHLFLTASQLPVGKDAHTVEQDVPATEPENRNDWRYWMKRADSALEQNARGTADQAYRKALDLTRSEPGVNDWARIAVMNAYVTFLYDNERPLPAINWLRAEWKQVPSRGEYVRALLNRMARLMPLTCSDFLPTNEILWRCLEGQPRWDLREERVLLAMAEAGDATERERIWERAEKLAAGVPGRAQALIDVLLTRGATARAAALAQADAQQRKSDSDRRTAAIAELDAALTANDWPRASGAWSQARLGLTRDEHTHRIERLIETAAQAGAPEDAMKLFADWTRYDRNLYHRIDTGNAETRFVTRLAGRGLKDRLLRFYQEMAAADPNSHVPQDILPLLRNLSAVEAATDSQPQRAGLVTESH